MSFQLSALQSIERRYLRRCCTRFQCLCAHLRVRFKLSSRFEKVLFQHLLETFATLYILNRITSSLTSTGQGEVYWCLLEEFEDAHRSTSLDRVQRVALTLSVA